MNCEIQTARKAIKIKYFEVKKVNSKLEKTQNRKRIQETRKKVENSRN